MAEPSVYLEKISAFSRILRLKDFAVGPKETADACEILTVLGLEDREQVRTALRTVYAKSREEQISFDKAFDGFFISEEAMRRQAREQMEKEREIQENIDALKKSGYGEGLSEEQQHTYGAMPEEVRFELDKFAGNMERFQQRAQRSGNLYASFIKSVFARTIMEQQMLMEDAGVGAAAMDPEMGLLYQDVSQFQGSEIPRAIDMIQNIARQINGELSAKRRRAGHSGKLDFRRTIRKGLETGGSFYRLAYRKKRKRRKSLVLLCDVSASMVQFSEFALRFIQSLNQASESSRVFLFSEETFEADAFSLQNMDLFRDYVRDCGIYGKGTDLGQALQKLLSLDPPALNSAATFLILSDTKTVNEPEALEALREAKRRAGRTLILNPLPEHRWKYMSGYQGFSSLCTMLPCGTLNDLAAACRKLSFG